MALIKLSSADVCNTRLAWGLAYLSKWRKCNLTSIGSLPSTGAKPLYFPQEISLF